MRVGGIERKKTERKERQMTALSILIGLIHSCRVPK